MFLPHDAMLAWYMLLSCVCLSLCLSVHPSITCRYCVKTAKLGITQITPHDRPKKTWREIVEKDCQACGLNMEDTMDRSRWRKQIRDDGWPQ